MSRRLFIAMPLPEEAKDILVWIQKELKKDVAEEDVKWVERENLHQTLIFLGRTEEDRLRQVEEVMKGLLNQKPLSLSLSKLGFYPDFKRARIIWVGLGGEDERLSQCYHQLRMPLQLAEFDLDTRFSPHITLGRVKKVKGRSIFSGQKVSKIQEFLKEREFSFQGERIVLYESQLQSTGPVYTPIFEINLTSDI